MFIYLKSKNTGPPKQTERESVHKRVLLSAASLPKRSQQLEPGQAKSGARSQGLLGHSHGFRRCRTWAILWCFPRHIIREGLKMKHLEHNPEPIWDASIACGGLTCYATMTARIITEPSPWAQTCVCLSLIIILNFLFKKETIWISSFWGPGFLLIFHLNYMPFVSEFVELNYILYIKTYVTKPHYKYPSTGQYNDSTG